MGKQADAATIRLKAKLKVTSKPLPGVQRGGEEPEAHFILRLPENVAAPVRDALAAKDTKDASFMFSDDGRNASFTFDGVSRRARLVDLPTILETHKTFDNKQLYKIADISQMLIVDDAPPLPLAPPTLSGPRPKANDEEYQHPHGITPPLKYVRKRRFRKRAKWMVEDVEREVQRLLLADERSDQTRISFISRDEDEDLVDDVQVDDDDSDHLSVSSPMPSRARFDDDVSTAAEDDDEVDVLGRRKPRAAAGDEEEEEEEEEEEDGTPRPGADEEEEEEEEGEEGGEEDEEEEEEEEEASEDDLDVEGESVSQRQQRLAVERQAVVVQQMDLQRSLEERRKQLGAAQNPIIRSRMQTAVSELEARGAVLEEQLAAIDERIRALAA